MQQHHGHCSQEIREIIPVPLRCVRTTRSSTNSHLCQVLLPTSRTISHKSSFVKAHAIYGTSCLLLAFLSLTTCHLSNLRSINLIRSPSPLSLSLFLSSIVGALYRLPWHFLNITHQKNMICQQCKKCNILGMIWLSRNHLMQEYTTKMQQFAFNSARQATPWLETCLDVPSSHVA